MKQAKDFAKQDLGETFNVDLLDDKKKIVLNIGDDASEDGFIKLKKSHRPIYFKVTGNKLIDTYNQINAWLLDNTRVKIKDKANFFTLLSVMLGAGLPLVKSLDALAEQNSGNVRLSKIIFDLGRSVEHGSKLSDAMKGYGDVFDASEIGIVEAGEISGQLTSVLKNIAKTAERGYETRAKVRSAVMYPGFILLLLFGVMGVMFGFVIPKIKVFFATNNQDLPTLTKAVIAISDFFVNNFTFVSVSFLLGVLGLLVWRKTDGGRRFFDKLKINIPVFGEIFRKVILARFTSNFSNLLGSGVAIISSLEISAQAVGNLIYQEKILLASEDLKQGIPLGESLKDSPLFPPMLVNIVEVGEKTAQLDSVTEKVSLFYDEDVQNTIGGISKVIEPVLLVLIGVSVAVIVLAIMLPIIKLSDISALSNL